MPAVAGMMYALTARDVYDAASVDKLPPVALFLGCAPISITPVVAAVDTQHQWCNQQQ